MHAACKKQNKKGSTNNRAALLWDYTNYKRECCSTFHFEPPHTCKKKSQLWWPCILAWFKWKTSLWPERMRTSSIVHNSGHSQGKRVQYGQLYSQQGHRDRKDEVCVWKIGMISRVVEVKRKCGCVVRGLERHSPPGNGSSAFAVALLPTSQQSSRQPRLHLCGHPTESVTAAAG